MVEAFVMVTRSIFRDNQWVLHKAGCRDIALEMRKTGGHSTRIAADTPEAAVAQWLDEETREMGYDESTVDVAPCCKHK